MYACNSDSYNEQINEPITSVSQLQKATPRLSQTSPHVSLNRVNHHPTESSIESNKSTNSNKHLCEIKEFSDAIDAYFSSTGHYRHTVTQATVNQSIGCLAPIPSLFTPANCNNLINPSNLCNSAEKDDNNSTCPVVKDCSKAEQPWIPSVVKKILSCYYSELPIKSEFLSTQVVLDDFESLVLREAVQAFQDIAFTNPDIDFNNARLPYEQYVDPRPIELISSCVKLRSYRKLHIEDKISLTASAFFDLNCIKGLVNYDKTIDGWYWAGGILPRSHYDFANYSPELDNLVLTFPDCLRKDINIVALLYLIVLFNPDLPKLKFRNSIRQQQYIYIYLLKRYLESLFGSTCEASEYHYLLLAKIEQAMNLPDSAVYEQIQSGLTFVLRNQVVDLVKFKSLTM